MNAADARQQLQIHAAEAPRGWLLKRSLQTLQPVDPVGIGPGPAQKGRLTFVSFSFAGYV
ncbi:MULTISPECIES: hypothetical protein [Rhizobium]|uniref:hypothetical protein n=1 Tax=Rhizobium TaxID=379 RepID=UPI000BBD80DB|nr:MULTISPECIES: hypothetical protein [Rhizobium]PCK83822.1 hypothetical protein CPT32_27040 [Rhizobium sophoriradicis]